jgi:hypothetical protein
MQPEQPAVDEIDAGIDRQRLWLAVGMDAEGPDQARNQIRHAWYGRHLCRCDRHFKLHRTPTVFHATQDACATKKIKYLPAALRLCQSAAGT